MSLSPSLFHPINRSNGPFLSFLFTVFFFVFSSSFLLKLASAAATPLQNTSDAPSVLLKNVFQHRDPCFRDSFVWISENDDEEDGEEPFEVYASSKKCVARYKEAKIPIELPDCDPGLVDLSVAPVYVPKSQLSYPYANLNISILAHSAVDTIAFRLECLHAADGTDIYCSDSSSMYIDGVKEWPCRAMDLSKKVKAPVKLGYGCFRMTAYSNYAINVTVLPQMCRVSTIITGPAFDELFPEALVDPQSPTDSKNHPLWAPTIAADLSDPAGIFVHFGKAPEAYCDVIKLHIYKERLNESSSVDFLEDLEVKCPETSVLWKNMPKGRYLLTAYVPIRGCKFVCHDGDKHCLQCLRTHLTLDVTEHRSSLFWTALQTMKDYSWEIITVVGVIFGFIVVGFGVFCCIDVFKNWRESKRVENIQLQEYVKTMMVYADDCVEHRNCVRMFVECLRHCATCEPIFDMEKLLVIEPIVPSRWLIDQMATRQKFLIIMSECAVKILDTQASRTHHLVQARPFADLFHPAMEMIIRDATVNLQEAAKKYAIIRLPYSPEVPPNLAVLNFPTFRLPEQFGQMTAFIHGLEDVEKMNITQTLSQSRMNSFDNAVEAMKNFIEQNPNWLASRWMKKEDPSLPRIREAPAPFVVQTDEDRITASKKYGLEAPNEDSDEDGNPPEGPATVTEEAQPFILFAPDQPDSDESSSSSDDDDEEEDEDEEEEELHTVIYRPDPQF